MLFVIRLGPSWETIVNFERIHIEAEHIILEVDKTLRDAILNMINFIMGYDV